MPIYKFIIQTNHDARVAGYLKDAHALGFQRLKNIIVHDLYFIEGQLMQEELQELTLKLLTDPVTQTASWIELSPKVTPLPSLESDSVILEVSLRPGVTDPVAEQIVRAAQAIGGGLLALDLFETENGYTINEINHTMEFRNSITTTGVNIPQKMIQYVLQNVRQKA